MAGLAATSADFLGADVEELDRCAVSCRKASASARQAAESLRLLVRQPWAAGPFHLQFTGHLTATLIPALEQVSKSLTRFGRVLHANADAQRAASQGEPVDRAVLPHYRSPLTAADPTTGTVVPAATAGTVAALADVKRRHEAHRAQIQERIRSIQQTELPAAEKELERALEDYRDASPRERENFLSLGLRVQQGEDLVALLERRIASYEQLLTADTTILEFDPDAYGGDGRVVALVGEIGSQTRNVGILVPGMGADKDTFGDYIRHARTFVDKDLAMVVWLGADMPDGLIGPMEGAWRARLSREAAPDLVEFSRDLRQAMRDVGAGDALVTAMGHSYGAFTAGTAAAQGADFDRLLHVASAGSGYEVDEISDYRGPDRDNDGNPDGLLGVYSIIARDDPIANFQGGTWGRGVDPDELDGVVTLPAGDPTAWDGPEPWIRPERPQGRGDQIHSYYYFDPDTTAWREIKGVLEGERDPRPPSP